MILVKRKINVYRVSVCSTFTAQHLAQTRICLHFPVMFEPFFISSHHLYLSHFFLSVSCSLADAHWLTSTLSPPLSLCLRVSRSVFSLARWVIPALVTSSFSPLAYPHLLTSPPTRPVSIWPAARPELAVALINTSVRWYHHDRGHGSVTVCACVTEKEGGESMCVCVCLFLVDGAFTSLTLMHAACYHRRCMCGCVHVACLSAWRVECESMTDAHHI